MGRKCLLTGLICFIALVFYGAADREIPVLDERADRYFKDTTTDAALAYATIRGVNAVVSVLKESQLELSPAGVGLSIAAGQILDPIDDMTERLSVVVVTALVSLGLQKLTMEIGRQVPLVILSFVMLLLIVPVWFERSNRCNLVNWVLKLGALLLVLRLLLPVSSLLSDGLYQNLLKDEMFAAKKQLAVLSTDQEAIGGFGPPAQTGFIASFSQTAREKIDAARDLYQRISENGEEIIDALLRLTTVYVSLFVLQVIVIPVAMLWLMVLLVNSLFRPRPAALPLLPEKAGWKAGH